MKKLYIIYDGRAIPWECQSLQAKAMVEERQQKFKDGEKFKDMFFPGDTDRASILETCHTLEEAKKNAKDYGNGNCIYEYEIKSNELVNERFIEIV